VTLALAGCGRKGGLDLPPNGTPQPTAQTTTQPTGQARAADADTAPDAPANRGGGLFSTPDEAPTAAKGRKRSFILDPLLNN
jgi:predicted small lipoprotein YifL